MNPIAALLDDLRTKLPAASKIITEGAGAEVSQASLTGSLAAVTAAVNATPNSSNMFPSRESYLQFGYAIKAALPDHPAEALALFEDWCARWDGGVNEPDVVAADWRRMKPPYRRGASWLYELAEEYGEFDRATVWFDPIVEIDLNPFDVQAQHDVEGRRVDVYPLLTADEIINRPPPAFLVDRHIPEVSLGFLYSAPGAGKSFLALDMALSIATGKPNWHGDRIAAGDDTAVVYIAAEGSHGFRNRIRAWMTARNVPNLPKRFFMIEQTINFMRAEDVQKLLRTVRSLAGLRACLIVVDTVSRALPGADENLQKEMTLFVAACEQLKTAFRCAVLGVHHAGKAGDMRGSTVLLGAGDFVFKLEREQGKTIGRLHCEKQKDAPDGWDEPYAFNVIGLEDGESSLVVDRAELSVGPSVELTPAVSAAVLQAMREAWEAGEPWAKAPQTKERYYVRRMVNDFGFGAAEAESLVHVWEGSGVIRAGLRNAKRRRSGFEVVGDIGQPVRQEDVFA